MKGIDIMEKIILAEKQKIFADIIWDNAPITSKVLTEICEEKLQWKRTTTYTMLKNLTEKGIFINNNGTVEVLISKEEFGINQGKDVLDDNFGGSLPKFLTAFTRKNKLSKNDITQLQELIDSIDE